MISAKQARKRSESSLNCLKYNTLNEVSDKIDMLSNFGETECLIRVRKEIVEYIKNTLERDYGYNIHITSDNCNYCYMTILW